MKKSKDPITATFEENLSLLKEIYPGRVMLGTKEFCRATGISERTVFNWTSKNQRQISPIEFKKCGRRIMFPMVSVARFMSSDI